MQGVAMSEWHGGLCLVVVGAQEALRGVGEWAMGVERVIRRGAGCAVPGRRQRAGDQGREGVGGSRWGASG
ncbi:hypothetical protein SZ55_1104 [Pseudomonas sp. FeS53a]|nr:hypothetical protein SZ55_1104 [Pseudomonas sp. FeS53a]